VLGRGLLAPGWFFVATKGLVSSVGGKVLELHGGGRIARGDAKVRANLAALEDGCAGRGKQVRNGMVFALGEFKSAAGSMEKVAPELRVMLGHGD